MTEERTEQLAGGYDVVVIGGGAAGLSGALSLARSRRSVVVIDAGEPRNAPAAGVHVLLGHDGIKPSELLEKGRAEVRGYGAQIVDGRVVGARREGDGFEVELSDGRTTRARRLLVTTGLVDELPQVPWPRRTVGARRTALSLLPRVGGPRPGDRRAVDRTHVGAPGDALQSVE